MIREITKWTHIQSVWNHSGPSEVPKTKMYAMWGIGVTTVFYFQIGKSALYVFDAMFLRQYRDIHIECSKQFK